jgi:hypothetical protein
MSSTIFLDGDRTDAGVSGKHVGWAEFVYRVAPATRKEFNTIGLPLAPVACWRVDDARFDFDSSFVRPEARKEFNLLQDLVESHPGSPLSIFGHSDPTGDDAYNKRLSGRRARAVYAVLTRKADLWEELYSADNWGLKQVQTMLQALPDSAGQPFHAGAVDGKDGPQTQEALKKFQSAHAAAQSGKNDKPTRALLFSAYMDWICTSREVLKLTDADFLGKGADGQGKGGYQGCGEFNPVLVFSEDESRRFAKPELKSKRDTENLPNRRVTVFLFQKGRQITPAKWPCPRWNEGTADCKKHFFADGDKRRAPQSTRRAHETVQGTQYDTFGCRFYDSLAQRSPCEGTAKLVAFKLRLCDLRKDPIKSAPCRITQGQSVTTAETDPDDGSVLIIARRTPERLHVAWTTPELKDEDPYPFSLEMYVSPPPGDEGVFQRLHNVGYSHQRTLEEKSSAFQRDLGHERSGRLTDDEKKTLVDWHDGGQKPFKEDRT